MSSFIYTMENLNKLLQLNTEIINNLSPPFYDLDEHIHFNIFINLCNKIILDLLKDNNDITDKQIYLICKPFLFIFNFKKNYANVLLIDDYNEIKRYIGFTIKNKQLNEIHKYYYNTYINIEPQFRFGIEIDENNNTILVKFIRYKEPELIDYINYIPIDNNYIPVNYY